MEQPDDSGRAEPKRETPAAPAAPAARTPGATPPAPAHAGGIGGLLRGLLAHPLTHGRDLDDPDTTVLRRQIIRGKPFLRRIYEEWYAALAAALPREADVPGRVLELGSGAGFFKDVVPEVIASDIFHFPHLDLVLDGQRMPIADASLRAVAMTNVLHHLPDVRRFFREAARCVRPGGVVTMVEPWITSWSRLVYRRLHHEPTEPEAVEWSFPALGPLSSANQALAWIVFERDAPQFAREFPQWRIETIRPMMPLRYLVSGGVAMRSLVPSLLFRPMRAAESLLGGRAAMFAHVLLRRSEAP